jgi:hypothetical protein
MRAVERDPAARAALRRVQHRLRTVAEAFQLQEFRRELEQSRRIQQATIARIAEQIRQALSASGQDLAALGLPAPTTLEEWEHLAHVVEMPFETVRSGDYTLRDVYVMALAWLDRQAILRRTTIALGAEHDGRPAQSSRKFTVAALRDLTGLRNAALNRYAKLAGVRTPRRGERIFCYSLADVRRILDAIITHSSEKALLAHCRTALRSLQEITE